jgi:DNA repair exonuclease SbcCD ATPase subunit
MNDIPNQPLELDEEVKESSAVVICPENIEISNSEKKSPKSRAQGNHNERYVTFMAKQETLTNPEEKLREAISFMTATLASEQGTPHFKSFWDARSQALELFKECAAAHDRSELWEQYSALSKEARRLKSIFDEQGAFASEQIDMAIGALEAELENSDAVLEKTVFDDFLAGCSSLSSKKDYYYETQRALNLLNAQASRITGLRKELIRTEIRIKLKNKFFQRLSAAGDKVFPRRKELIHQISEQFNADVATFVESHFTKPTDSEKLFFLREEIKALQGAAKIITLNTQAFSRTRTILSECWDKVKVLDKERKKERAEMKEQFKINVDLLHAKINEISQGLESKSLSDDAALAACKGIGDELQRTPLGREFHQQLCHELSAVQKPIFERMDAEENLRRQEIEDRIKQKKNKAIELRAEIEQFMADLDSFDLDGIEAKRDDLQQKISALAATKIEKLELERLLKPVKDAIVDKKERALMSLSVDDRQAIQQLKDLLRQRQEQKQEIKGQLEALRRARGTSGNDFEQAMKMNREEATDKERLEKICHTISEIESKLKSLEVR